MKMATQSIQLAQTEIEVDADEVNEAVEEAVEEDVEDEVDEEDKVEVSELYLDISCVRTHHTLKIYRASLGQIVRSFQHFIIKEPKNVYQHKLNRLFFKKSVPEFISKYNDLLQFSTVAEHDVKYINLVGPLPTGLVIQQTLKGSPILNIAKVGDVIEALRQRATFIRDRDLPSFYDDKPEYAKCFKNMQLEMDTLLTNIDHLEDSFIEAIDRASKAQQADYIKKNMFN